MAAAERWQKRVEMKASSKSKEIDSEVLLPNANGGKVSDRWTDAISSRRYENPEAQESNDVSDQESTIVRSDPTPASEIKDAYPDRNGSLHRTGAHSVVSSAMSRGLGQLAPDQSETTYDGVTGSTSSHSPNRVDSHKKKSLMQLGRKHVVNKPKNQEELVRATNTSELSTPERSRKLSSIASIKKTGIPSYRSGSKSSRAGETAKSPVRNDHSVADRKAKSEAAAASAISQRIAKERLFSKKKLQSQRRSRKARSVDRNSAESKHQSKIPPPAVSGMTVFGLPSSSDDNRTEKALSDFSLLSDGDPNDVFATGSNVSSSSLANKAEKLLQRRRQKGAVDVEPEPVVNPEMLIPEDSHDDFYHQDQAADALEKIQRSLDETPFEDQQPISHRPHGGFEDPSFDEQDSLVQESQSQDGKRRLNSRYNSPTRFIDESFQRAAVGMPCGGDSIESSLLSQDSVTTDSFGRHEAVAQNRSAS